MSGIKVGDRAPQFTATSHTGEPVSLADFLGKKVVVLYFYPRDGTRLCTAEACGFRDAYEEFAAAGAVVLGVSRDSVEKHREFIAARQLPFILLSDTEGALEKIFGVPKLLGFLPGRTTYVIDKTGIVRHVFSAHFSAKQHIEAALRKIRELYGRMEDTGHFKLLKVIDGRCNFAEVTVRLVRDKPGRVIGVTETLDPQCAWGIEPATKGITVALSEFDRSGQTSAVIEDLHVTDADSTASIIAAAAYVSTARALGFDVPVEQFVEKGRIIFPHTRR